MASILFEPVKIKKLELKNRFMRSATWDGTADESGAVTEKSINLYRELGHGDIGLIVTGYAFVSHPLGQANPGQYGIYKDDLIPGWKHLVNTVHEAGASRIAMQIVHAGINSNYLVKKGFTLQAVSDNPDLKRPHKEMTEEEIEAIIDDYSRAAVRVREAGFDALQLHGAHGYQMSQFVSPIYNHRRDRWGGNPENRRRFHIEIIRKIRKVLGEDFPLFIKFGVQDDQEGGMPLSEGVEICRQMEKEGIDFIEISAGVGTGSAAIVTKGKFEKAVFRERAALVKKAVTIPVGVVNGIRSLSTSEEIIIKKEADIISLCRPFIREPRLVSRWLKGDSGPAACISCNKCFPNLDKGGLMECGEERRSKEKK